MISNAERSIVKIKNELRAMKTSFKYAISSVLMPDNVPTVSWSGNVSFNGGTSEALARFRVRFKRDGGRAEPPLVDFALKVGFTPSYVNYSETNQRVRITGDDPDFTEASFYRGYVAEAGDDYIEYYIDIELATKNLYSGLSGIDVAINVEAISVVKGTLTIERVF